MNLRDNILIQSHAIGAEDIRSLADHIALAPMSDSLVSNVEDDPDEASVEWVVNKKIRDTQEVQLTTAVKEKLKCVLDESISKSINAFYNVEVSAIEPPQILHYGVGGHYISHVDAETLYKDDSGLNAWEKTLERDLSIVYFLNDNFAGGELVFPELDLIVKPQAGTLVCFPSDHNYIHGVKPVTSGHRYTLVTWMRVKGMPAMEEINQLTMDEYYRVWPEQMEQLPRIRKGGVTT